MSRVRALPDEIDLQGAMEAGNGIRIEVSRGMRAPIVDGEVTLQACWRADCYTKPDRRWLFLITLVDDTLPGLFAQFAALSTEGKVKVTR